MAKLLRNIFQFKNTRLSGSDILCHRGPTINFSGSAGHRRSLAMICRDESWNKICAKQHNYLYRFFRKEHFLSTGHLFHTSSMLLMSENSVENSENLIEAWFNEVDSFGAVSVRNVPFDVRIQPLSPMDYPLMNKSIVKLYHNATQGQGVGGGRLSDMGKLCKTCVRVQGEGERVEVSCDVPQGVQLPLICVITVPLKFGVEVEGGGGGGVVISGLESDVIKVNLTQGHCHLVNLKTGATTVTCDQGDITSTKQLLGAIQLCCGQQGSITAERLQGTSVDISTEGGDIDVKTIYADKTCCQSQAGSLHIRDCHGDVTVSSQSGNMTIDSLDGKLMAQLDVGSADVFITRPDDVSVSSQQGDITLRFSEEGSSSVVLDAAVIERDDSLPTVLDDQGKGFIKSETEQVVKASAPKGQITLKKQDWLSAINLQFGK